MKTVFVVLVVMIAMIALIGGCATPISKNAPLPLLPGVARDLVATGWNLDQAVAVGALDAADPAVGCIHGVLAEAGLDAPVCVPPVAPATAPVCPPAPASFVPENRGAVSAGSIVYIHAQQLRGLARLVVPMECDALVGQFVRLGLTKSAPTIAK
jgi:hypothetical protein